MSIPDNLSVRIIEAVNKHKISGNALMLGRQNFLVNIRNNSRIYLQDVLNTYYPNKKNWQLAGEDGYAETFFKEIGFDKIDSMDASNFEGASIIHDLGSEVPKKLHNGFDYIYDGGTCEHIFELPTALRNVDKMLKPGGIFQAHSPSNNFVNHGFYQISPEMVFGFWVNAMGYELLSVELVPLRPKYIGQSYGLSNPLETKKRPRISGDLPVDSPIILDYLVRKPLKAHTPPKKIMQSDYAARWEESDAESGKE